MPQRSEKWYNKEVERGQRGVTHATIIPMFVVDVKAKSLFNLKKTVFLGKCEKFSKTRGGTPLMLSAKQLRQAGILG